MEKIKVYTSSTCPYCVMAKEYLEKKGLEFEEKNVQTDKTARQELMKMGYTGVPVVVIGDEEIVGFDEVKLEKALEK